MSDEENPNQQMPTRQLFSRFLIFGVVVLVSTIFFVKASHQSHIFLGLAVFTVNVLAIFGYARSVKNADNFYSDEEADDLAYYLGFILTICALASIFVMDALRPETVGVKAQSDLIKHALFQFGIGLTATMIGLWARIYLNSKQQEHSHQLSQDPQKTFVSVYRALSTEARVLKQEMQDFNKSFSQSAEDLLKNFGGNMADLLNGIDQSQKAMLKTTKKYTDTLDSCSNELVKVAESLQKSSSEAFSALVDANRAIINNFNDKALGQSITEFSDALKRITQNFASTEQSFATSFKAVNSTTNDVLSKLSTFATNSQSVSTEFAAMRTNIRNSSESVDILSKEVSALATTLVSSKPAFDSFAKTARSFENINLEITSAESGVFGKLLGYLRFWK